MSEAIWIELIKILPTFMWVSLGVGALLIARRLLAQQAHRMTRVESPFVSVDFAQDAIAQAFNRGPESRTPAQGGDSTGPIEGPPTPDEVLWRQETEPEPVAADRGAPDERAAAGDGSGAGPWLRQGPASDPDKTHALRPRQRPASEDMSDEDEFDLSSLLDDGASGADEDGVPTAPAEHEPRPAEAPPNASAPYPPGLVPQGFQSMYPPPPATGTTAYRPPSYYAVTTDPHRGLRAATRLAGAADLLQGGAILWVDDHHRWNEPLVRLFRTAGMKVDTVSTTEETLRHLDKGSYDLVITDLRRERDPGDGVAGMALLDRMVARGIPTPAVVFSDNPQVRAMSHPRAAATTNSPEDLVNRVVDLVGHRRAALNQPQAAKTGGFFFGNS
ncbi:response regulator [Glycomyces sp. TRM65418]|uniref:response regulator n=1 Tax=Glycomyces sp. TRM65418 TaxID=2867006 RepID=UPI001CE6FFC9|nr:response regulator [Glycomyces sp. TRM65418]MCC3765406.1 response regulator [Glycomyces sp. TRM65418]QZD55017.1 response regulator [Glycomyces sp. TRM65418]